MNRRQRKLIDSMLRKEASNARNVEPPTHTERLEPVPRVQSMRARHNEEYLRRVRAAPPLRNDNLPRKVSWLTVIGAVGYQPEMGFMVMWSAGWLAGTHLSIGNTGPWWPLLMLAVAALALALVWTNEVTGVIEASRILRFWHLTWGLVTRRLEQTYVTQDWEKNTVHGPAEIQFMYAAPTGQLVSTDVKLFTKEAQVVLDDELELLLCNPDLPSEVKFVDLLPGSLRINSDGRASAAAHHTALGVGVLLLSILVAMGLLWGLLRIVIA